MTEEHACIVCNPHDRLGEAELETWVLCPRHAGQAFAPQVQTPSYEDQVNHPKHYTFGKYEVIDVIEDWRLSYHLGNAVKYIARAGRKTKDPKQDLEKAIWYLCRELERTGDDD